MQKSTEKKEQLLNAGLLLLMEHLPDSISMDDIATKAGVTKPMVYYYFGSKLGYYQQLVKYIEDSMQEMLDDCFEKDISFREFLTRIIEKRIVLLINHPEISNAVQIMVTGETIGGASSRSRIVAVFTRFQPVFNHAISSGEIREDAELHLVMALLNSLLDGALRIHGKEFFVNKQPAPLAEMLVRQVFDGIGTGKRS